MTKTLLIALFAVTFASGTAHAAHTAAAAYGSAGCGLGSQVITDGGIMQIFAATTNDLFAIQFFAITSGTSNCGPSSTYAKADAAQEMYVSSNLDALSEEMAQGSGEHLAALASLLGCDKKAGSSFNSAVRKNYGAIVGDEANTARIIQGVRSTVAADPVLNKSCNG